MSNSTSSQEDPSGTEPDQSAIIATLSNKIVALMDEMDEIRGRVELLEARGDEKQLFDVRDLMQRWDLSERTIRHMIAEREVTPTYIGSSLRVTRQAVLEYEEGRTGLQRGKEVRRAPTGWRISPTTGYAERFRLPLPPRPPEP